MPHIVLEKSLNLFDFSILFKPTFQKSPLIKIQDMYIDTRGTNVLLSTVVIDDSHHEFLIELKEMLSQQNFKIETKKLFSDIGFLYAIKI